MMKNEGKERDYYEMNYQESSLYNTNMGCGCMNPCDTMCPPICECPQNQA